MYCLLWFSKNERGNIWLVVMILKNERGNLWLVVMILKKMKEVIMFWYCWEKMKQSTIFKLTCLTVMFFLWIIVELLYCYDMKCKIFSGSIFYTLFPLVAITIRGFPANGGSQKWMVYEGTSHSNGWFEGYFQISGNLQYLQMYPRISGNLQYLSNGLELPPQFSQQICRPASSKVPFGAAWATAAPAGRHRRAPGAGAPAPAPRRRRRETAGVTRADSWAPGGWWVDMGWWVDCLWFFDEMADGKWLIDFDFGRWLIDGLMGWLMAWWDLNVFDGMIVGELMIGEMGDRMIGGWG